MFLRDGETQGNLDGRGGAVGCWGQREVEQRGGATAATTPAVRMHC